MAQTMSKPMERAPMKPAGHYTQCMCVACRPPPAPPRPLQNKALNDDVTALFDAIAALADEVAELRERVDALEGGQ